MIHDFEIALLSYLIYPDKNYINSQWKQRMNVERWGGDADVKIGSRAAYKAQAGGQMMHGDWLLCVI